ncbi:MAG: DUF695 domain-containing protein [Myxococcales bacterium]|nr:DUF695 domain-containing protein [Myxococcales bacterium]
MAKRETAFNFYPAEINGSPAAVVVDLAAEPDASRPYRIAVRFDLREPDEEGLRSEDEEKALEALDEKIEGRLASAFGAVLVGFYDHAGTSTLIHYAKKNPSAADVKRALGDLGPYDAQAQVEEDEEWAFFTDQLYPDANALQMIMNRLTLAQMERAGDVAEAPREIDHAATFATKAAADQAGKALSAHGFHVHAPSKTDDGSLVIEFHREDALAAGRIDEVTQEILEIVLGVDGDYDGWGAPVMSPAKKAPAKAEKKAAPAKAEKKAAPAKKALAKKAPAKKAPAKKAPAKKAPAKKAPAKKAPVKKGPAKKPAKPGKKAKR